MRDIHHTIAIETAIVPALLSADGTPVEVDLQGYDAAEVVLSIGPGGISFTEDNKIEFILSHSLDGVTYTPVTAGDLDGLEGDIEGGVILSLTEEKPEASMLCLGYVGALRYLKLSAVFSGTHAEGTAVSAVVIKGRPNLT